MVSKEKSEIYDFSKSENLSIDVKRVSLKTSNVTLTFNDNMLNIQLVLDSDQAEELADGLF